MNRANEPVRVGLLGCGAVAQVAHLPAYRRLRNVKLVALCDAEAPKLRALRERTEVPHAVRSLDELLAIDEVEAVDVCLPSHLHREAVLGALAAGKHVLCEKPLALTPQDVVEIMAAQRASGRVVLVGMNNRYRDDSIVLKRFIEEGSLGQVFHGRASWLRRRDRLRSTDWQYQKATSGGGVFMDLGIQLLDLMLWLAGYPHPERAAATFYHHTPGIEVEDTAVVSLRCARDFTVSLQASWRFLAEPEEQRLELFGTDGSGLLSSVGGGTSEPRIQIYQRLRGGVADVTPPSQRPRGHPYMESYEREIAFFGEVVAGREDMPPLEEQLALARAVEAIARSAQEGREVRAVERPAEAGVSAGRATP
jgi:predicted dehydrogenase